MKVSYFGSGPKFPVSHRGNLGLTPGLFFWEMLWIKCPIRPIGFCLSPSVFHGQCHSINTVKYFVDLPPTLSILSNSLRHWKQTYSESKKKIHINQKEPISEFYDKIYVHKREKIDQLLNDQNLIPHHIILDELINEQNKTCIAG
jgi:hypothetical protein